MQIRTITSSDEIPSVSVESLTSTTSSAIPIQDMDTFNKAILRDTYLNVRRYIYDHLSQKDVSSLFYSTSVSEDDFYIDHCIHVVAYRKCNISSDFCKFQISNID